MSTIYKVRISGGVVCLDTISEANTATDYMHDVKATARLAESAPDLLAACEALRKTLEALSCRIDEEMDLDNHDKPNWAMRLGAEFSGDVGRAFNVADAAIAKARGGK